MARILVLASYAQSLVTFRGALLMEMVAQGHDVIGCAPDAPSQVRRDLQKMGVSYQDIRLERVGMNPFKDVMTIINLVRLFGSCRPDIVLSYTIKPVIHGSLAARLANVSHVYSIITGLGYTFGGEGLKRKLLGIIARVLYRIALACNTRVFFQNPDDARLFQQKAIIRDAGKIVLINGSGIDIEAYQVAEHPAAMSFLLIARLLKAKGIREYAEAAAIVRKKYPHVRFRLVGWIDLDNPDSVSEQDVHQWVASGTIEYLGRLEDVRQAIADASVYVLPSYREGTPRSVLEAMAMGRPIITTDVPGCRETLVERGNGFLVPVKDVAALAEAIEEFIRHPEYIPRMGKESRRIAMEKYDVRKVNREILRAMGAQAEVLVNAHKA